MSACRQPPTEENGMYQDSICSLLTQAGRVRSKPQDYLLCCLSGRLETHHMKRSLLCSVFLVLFTPAHAQWTLQDAHTSADLEAIHSLGGGIAWASGKNGSVLRTVDNGATWHVCAIPEGAETFDFVSVQGFTRDAAIVMSSGLGERSRLYKTIDGCSTWRNLLTNSNSGDSWIGIQFANAERGFLIGAPGPRTSAKERRIILEETYDRGDTWRAWQDETPALALQDDSPVFITGFGATLHNHVGEARFAIRGSMGSRIYQLISAPSMVCSCSPPVPLRNQIERLRVNSYPAPLDATSEAGIVAMALTTYGRLMVVGGDPMRPDSAIHTAALSRLSGISNWSFPEDPPHGYRSAVAYDSSHTLWITVGPNGTDVSSDDGIHWSALKPNLNNSTNSDPQWTSLSLPFAVGPHGRIGKLDDSFLQ